MKLDTTCMADKLCLCLYGETSMMNETDFVAKELKGLIDMWKKFNVERYSFL